VQTLDTLGYVSKIVLFFNDPILHFVLDRVFCFNIMRVLNISKHDYANMSHQNANALRAVGVDVDDVCIKHHLFLYNSQSKRVHIDWIRHHFAMYDVVQVFHSDPIIYDMVKEHPNVVVYHTGTQYRQHKAQSDEMFKGRKIITDQCEFLLHNPTFHYLAPHTNLKPINKANKKLVIGHYPSNQDVKGTVKIEEMLRPFKNMFDIRINVKKTTHEDNLKRMAQCDIYIELFNEEQKGQPYGCFGVTAFEATALGCLVITQNINKSAYEDVYGVHPFLIANDEKTFNSYLLGLSDRENFEITKESFHAGFYEKHGIVQTGLRIKSLIE
jgi:hypothetical protein